MSHLYIIYIHTVYTYKSILICICIFKFAYRYSIYNIYSVGTTIFKKDTRIVFGSSGVVLGYVGIAMVKHEISRVDIGATK